MPEQPTVLVTGATGAQGGGVARHLLQSGRWKVRCLTRRPDSEKARTLAAAGAELAAGDLAQPESLREALRGCRAVFGVTNFWEHFGQELDQGRNLLRAVAEAGTVEQFIFSTLPPARRISGLDVPHFDIKAQLEDEARSLGLPMVALQVAFYFENFLYFAPPRYDPATESFVFGFPQGDTPLAGLAVEDAGGVVAGILANWEAYAGKTVGAVGDEMPPAGYAAALTGATGKRFEYRYIPREVFATLDFPGADDLANMFEFNRLHIPSRRADILESRNLYPGMRTFEVWAAQNREPLLRVLSA